MNWIDVNVDFHGVVFDGDPVAIIDRACTEIEDVLGETGVAMIRAYLPTQYMYLGHNGGNPTDNPVPPNAGYYQNSIMTERSVQDELLILGDRATYGAWIEGVSSLNNVIWPGRKARGLSGRFPGYHAFRKITIELNDMAGDVAEAVVRKYVDEINS